MIDTRPVEDSVPSTVMQTSTHSGNSGLEFTKVGIGTWAIGGGDWSFGWGDQDEREAIEGIRRGVELGVNWIDTAAIYGDGASEAAGGEGTEAEIPEAERPHRGDEVWPGDAGRRHRSSDA